MQFYTRPRRKPTVIIVTMIDVFCVLLIFFIAATTFRKSLPAIKITLPEARKGEQVSQTEPVMLTVSADEEIFLNSKKVPIAQLGEALQQLGAKSPPPPLAMQADKKAPFGLIIRVMDAAKTAGFAELPAVIDPETPKTP